MVLWDAIKKIKVEIQQRFAFVHFLLLGTVRLEPVRNYIRARNLLYLENLMKKLVHANLAGTLKLLSVTGRK
eukprot:4529803-Ditylum_brightwellii.AAC.1